ncbi:hypothetical protein BMS3Bbin15_01089 [archaeon BMS3Bbin15]|nr:hypothetical protein BMS3Bbin15_01089 [archaeon BMS3Bbin15]
MRVKFLFYLREILSMLPADYLILGIGSLFFLSVLIVIITSWIMGRGRGYSRRPVRRKYTEEEEFYSPPVKRENVDSAPSSGMETDIVKQILEAEIPDSPSASAGKFKSSTTTEVRSDILDAISDIDLDGLDETGEDYIDEVYTDDLEIYPEEEVLSSEPEDELEESEEEFMSGDETLDEKQDEAPEFSGESLDKYGDELDFLYNEEESEKEVHVNEGYNKEEGDLDFLFEHEGNENEAEKIEEKIKEETDIEESESYPDCFGDSSIYSRCSKSCGIGEKCKNKVNMGA